MPEPFVARTLELRQLDHFLDKAVRGQGQICFLTGEAGAGKSALAAAFARRVKEKHPDLIVATGVCNAQAGIGDPYLPMREVLSLLLGDMDNQSAQATLATENTERLQKLLVVTSEILLKYGPDLIGLVLPGVTLLAKLGQTLAEQAELTKRLRQRLERRHEQAGLSQTRLDQTQIFEQYVNVVRELAKHQPLLLILDDLHWADPASIGLLFYLGRRLEGSRILVIGAYRPEEVALGRAGERHPLEKVLAEFKRYYGDIWIDLDQIVTQRGREFIDVLLDSEPNQLDDQFRRALLAHTGGNPLFTVELLRHLQESGDLVKSKDGDWLLRSHLNWSVVPKRVEGVIEERLARLAAELRHALTVASIEGEQFTAEVVARIRAQEARSLVQQLSSELEKEHRLVASQGVQRLAGQRLSHYRFSHHLVQRYLYAQLSAVELAYLHEDVGLALETLYGEQADAIAPQLARHFELADMSEKARHYLRRAGEQAAAAFANQEALHYLDRALALTPVAELEERFALLWVRESVYDLGGMRDAQAQDLATLEGLAERLADPARRAGVALRNAHYAEAMGNYATAAAAAQQAITLAHSVGALEGEARGYWAWGIALWRQADYTTAMAHYRQALALAQQANLPLLEADALRGLGTIAGDLGDYAAARRYYDQSLALSRQHDDRRGESATLNNLGAIAFYQSDYTTARTYLEQSMRLRRTLGDRHGESLLLGNLGALADNQGDFLAASDYAARSLRLCQEVGNRAGACTALVTLGRSALHQGDPTQAHSHFEDALRLAHEIDDQLWAREALAGLGGVALYWGDGELAQTYYEQALRLARQLDDRRHEGKHLGNLGQVAYLLGKVQAAADLSRQALAIAEALGDSNLQADALFCLGHALVEQGNVEGAETAYRRTLEARQRLSQATLAVEALALLAHMALRRGDVAQAATYADEVLGELKTMPLSALQESIVYWTLYQVLHDTGDARAREILQQAHTRLQARAAQIADERLRRSFLHNVPWQHALVVAWEQTRVP